MREYWLKLTWRISTDVFDEVIRVDEGPSCGLTTLTMEDRVHRAINEEQPRMNRDSNEENEVEGPRGSWTDVQKCLLPKWNLEASRGIENTCWRRGTWNLERLRGDRFGNGKSKNANSIDEDATRKPKNLLDGYSARIRHKKPTRCKL